MTCCHGYRQGALTYQSLPSTRSGNSGLALHAAARLLLNICWISARRLDGLDQGPGREWLGQIGDAAGIEGVATDGLLVTRRDKYHRHRMTGSREPAAQSPECDGLI